MGQLVDGEWKTEETIAKTSEGRFQRPSSTFRNWVTADGRAGPTGKPGFKAEAGR